MCASAAAASSVELARRQSPPLSEHVRQRCGFCLLATGVRCCACRTRHVAIEVVGAHVGSRRAGGADARCRCQPPLLVEHVHVCCRVSLRAQLAPDALCRLGPVMVARVGSCRARGPCGLVPCPCMLVSCRVADAVFAARLRGCIAAVVWVVVEDSMRRAAARSVSRVVFAGPPL